MSEGAKGKDQVPLPGMTALEEISAEYRVQGLSARLHPMQIIRNSISRDGVLRSSDVLALSAGTRVRTAGYVVCRQAPRTAKGYVFLTLEDEDGLLNIILKPQVYQKYRYVTRMEPLIVVEGVLQKKQGMANVIAERLVPLRKESERQLAIHPQPAPQARNFA